MNKKELIEKYAKFEENFRNQMWNIEDLGSFDRGELAGESQLVSMLLNDLKQLDEPEKVVIPQFVDKWLKRRKKDFESANIAMMYINACGWDDETHIEYKLYKWIPENTIAFCEAWEHGYTIEQPKLLTVIVKDYDKTIMSKQLPEDEVNKMM